MAWSRVFDTEEALCVVNQHGSEERGARILVDAGLNQVGSTFTIRANTEEAAAKASGQAFNKPKYAVGQSLTVKQADDGTAYVDVFGLGAAEVIVMVNE